jgi:nucleoside-diphosphate-sugar epimerase
MRAMQEHRPGKLLLTGVPGWLADAFLQSLARGESWLGSVRCLVHWSNDLGATARERWGVDAEIVHGDLTAPESLDRAMQGVDTVLHAAAIMHVERIEDYYAVNSLGTRSLVRAATRAGVRRFVYVSSNAAGGRSPAPTRLMHEDDPAKPLSHYGRSKLLAERWLFDAEGAIERVVLRPCMFYGPPVPERHVDVYKRILSGRMPLVGSGQYARSLVHIDNLLQAVRLALTRSAPDNQAYYIADRAAYTTRGVVEAMARALEVEPRFLRLPAVVAEVAWRADTLLAMGGAYHQTLHLVGEGNWNVGVSIDKARAELGYDPQVDVDAGMRQAVAWCRERALL